MNFLEKDLEEIIYNADKELLAKRGLIVNGILKRQLKIGNYGIADLVTFNRISHKINNRINTILVVTVYELKQNKIGISSFLQAVGYVKGIKSYLEKRNFKFDIEFEIVLIGKEIDKNSTFSYLSEILPNTFYFATSFLSCFTYSYNIDGIRFNEEYGYSLINEGFNLL